MLRALVLADREPRPSVEALLAAGRIDAILGLGDLQPSWVEGVAAARQPKLGVYGIHDDAAYMAALGMEDVHLRLARLGDLSVAGFEGCVRYRRDGAFQYTQAEASAMAASLPAKRVRPRYVLHGHTYPPPGRVVRRFGETCVIHVAGARVVELEPG